MEIIKEQCRIYREKFGKYCTRCYLRYNGTDIGHLYITKGKEKNEIWSFSIDPEFQNQHLGTEFLTRIFRLYPKKPFCLGVYKDNYRAKHLYEKLGFVIVEDCGDYFEMERNAGR